MATVGVKGLKLCQYSVSEFSIVVTWDTFFRYFVCHSPKYWKQTKRKTTKTFVSNTTISR